jgi:hypothetical protein
MPDSKSINVSLLPDESLASEEKVFRRKRNQFLMRYEGQFIALYHGRVIGSSTDDEELAGKMFKKLGDVPFYIVKVEREATVYDLPTPEIVR